METHAFEESYGPGINIITDYGIAPRILALDRLVLTIDRLGRAAVIGVNPGRVGKHGTKTMGCVRRMPLSSHIWNMGTYVYGQSSSSSSSVSSSPTRMP